MVVRYSFYLQEAQASHCLDRRYRKEYYMACAP